MVKTSTPSVNANNLFREAATLLCSAATHQEVAEELDCSLAAFRAALRDPSSPAFRSPPAGWEMTFIKLLELKSIQFAQLAAMLKNRKRDL